MSTFILPTAVQEPDTNPTMERFYWWLALSFVMMWLTNECSIAAAVLVLLAYALMAAVLAWLLTHPLRPVLVAYTRGFESRSKTLLKALILIFVGCVIALAAITISLIEQGNILQNSSSLLRNAAAQIVVIFIFSGFELRDFARISGR